MIKRQEAEVLSSEDVDALQGIVGGSDGYGNMMQWAQILCSY